MKSPIILSSGFILLLLGAPTAAAQDFRLAPVPPNGHFIPPWFEGWYLNPDGGRTFSFGYFNQNRADTLEVALGPDNYIEPAEFNGMQPTSFPPGRHVGVFAVTVPPGYDGDVVWHLRTMDRANSVPGRSTAPAYELGYQPMALGSVPPLVRFEPGGAEAQGPQGGVGEQLQARVGTPLQLTVWTADHSVRERPSVVGITWYKHQGPGRVIFSGSEKVEADGRGVATATFDAPGEYLIRVRADNFDAADSTPADQCCWTNAYIPVTVTM